MRDMKEKIQNTPPVPALCFEKAGGLNMLEHFALNAPDSPPHWFQPKHVRPKPEEPNPDELGDAGTPDREAFNQWFWTGETSELNRLKTTHPKVHAFIEEKYKPMNEAIRRWTEFEEANRFFQWRWYFAEQMLVNAQIVRFEQRQLEKGQ